VSEQPPLLRVVRGEPSAEELAALVAVVTATMATARARAASADRGGSTARTDRAAVLTPLPPPGPGAWRRSALPT
jgi:hypothetical protein